MRVSVVTLFAILGSLTACSNTHMVQSVAIDTAAKQSSADNGVIYSLPKQLVRVKYSRALLDKDETKNAYETALAKTKTLKAELEKLKGEIATLESQIKKITTDENGGKELRLRFQQNLTELKIQQDAKTKALTKAIADEESALENWLKFVVDDSAVAFSESLSIDALEPTPDVNKTFSANISSTAMSTDKLNIEVENGLLSGAVGYTEGNVGEVLLAIAKSFATLSGASAKSKNLVSNIRDVQVAPKCMKAPLINIDTILDIGESTEVALLNSQLAKGCLAIHVSNDSQKRLSNYENASVGQADGLLYTHPGTVVIEIMESQTTGRMKLLTTKRLLLTQAGRIAAIEMPRSNFAKNDYQLAFSKGRLKSAEIYQPSEILALANYIPEIGKSLLSIPAELIQIKLNYSTAEAAIVEQQKILAENEKAKLKALEDLEKAKMESNN